MCQGTQLLYYLKFPRSAHALRRWGRARHQVGGGVSHERVSSINSINEKKELASSIDRYFIILDIIYGRKVEQCRDARRHRMEHTLACNNSLLGATKSNNKSAISRLSHINYLLSRKNLQSTDLRSAIRKSSR
jgi:hypothetical protein